MPRMRPSPSKRSRPDDPAKNWTPGRRRMLVERFRTVPYPNWLGLKLAKLSAGQADLSLVISKQHQQYRGIAHGGALASLADTAATFAALTIIPNETDVVTIEFKVNFLASMTGGAAVARGSVVRVGSRVAVSDVRVYGPRKDRLIMTGTFTMLVFPKPGDLTGPSANRNDQ